jgi:hypothetical protein
MYWTLSLIYSYINVIVAAKSSQAVMHVNRTRLILEALPFLLVMGILVLTNLTIRKRHKDRDRSEWNQIYDAAQMGRQQVLQALRLTSAGLPATPLTVAPPSEMSKLKLS